MSTTGKAESYIELKGSLSLPDSIKGKSAYEIAVMHGFDGTEAEWLVSLTEQTRANAAEVIEAADQAIERMEETSATECESIEAAGADALNDIAEAKATMLEEIEIAAEIVQTAGDSETTVMSQKAVTEELTYYKKDKLSVNSVSGKRDAFTIQNGSGSFVHIGWHDKIAYGTQANGYGNFTTPIAELNTEHKYFLYVNFEKCIDYTLTAGKIAILNKYADVGKIASVHQPKVTELSAVFTVSNSNITAISLYLGSVSNENTELNDYAVIDLTNLGWENLSAADIYEKFAAEELNKLGNGKNVAVGIPTFAKNISYDNSNSGMNSTNMQDGVDEVINTQRDTEIGIDRLLFGKPLFAKCGNKYKYEANKSYQDVVLGDIDGVFGGGIYSLVYSYVNGLDLSGGYFVARYYNESGAQIQSKQVYTNDTGIMYLYPPTNTTKMRLELRLVAEAVTTSGTVELGSVTIYQGRASFNHLLKDEKPIPSYYIPHLVDKEATILTRGEMSALNGDSFVFFSDYHMEGNIEHSPALIKHIIDNTHTRFVMFGGDSINNGYDQNGNDNTENVRNRFLDFKEKFNFLPLWKFRKVIGNHEWNNPALKEDHTPELTSEQVHLYYAKEDEEFNVFSPNRMSFYFDNKTQKIRYFGMGCLKDAYIPTDSLHWLFEQFEELPADYAVVIFGHKMISQDGLPIANSKLSSGFDVLKTGGSYTYDNQTYNFTAHDVLGVFSGDIHHDALVYTTGGIPFIATTCDCYSREAGGLDRTVGTINEQAFDVVNIDRTNRKIHMTRIGSGEDREINY